MSYDDVHVTLIRVSKGADPMAVPPAGWTKVCDFDADSILCRMVSDGGWSFDSHQDVRVLSSFIAARIAIWT
jgi:hypothetical protein